MSNYWLSLLPLAFVFFPYMAYSWFLRSRNLTRRGKLLRTLGVAEPRKTKLVGLFHPFCHAGGGGERVLWTVIASLQRKEPHVVCVVYTGDVGVAPEEILRKVKSRFNIELSLSKLYFVFLRSRHWVEDTAWPRFTLAGQSFGSMYLVWEAMHELIPDLYIDTMGYAFTFPVVSWFAGIPVGAYTHYPTISTDMISRVRTRKRWHTNSEAVSSSHVLSTGKLLYYRLFMYLYSICLWHASFLMVNSSWTKNHIDFIINYSDWFINAALLLNPFYLLKYLMRKASPLEATIVYPPCDTRAMAQFPLDARENVVLSIAQFRPEKDHPSQLYAFAELLRLHPEYKRGRSSLKLILIGGCRSGDDEERVDALRALSKRLEIDSQVEFIANAPYTVILDWLSRASIGLSTMVDEHFGINIVEFMAAGAIPITHASGGPLKDIVVPVDGEPTGFHAKTPSEFAAALHDALSLPPEEQARLRGRARTWAVRRFSAEEFEKGWDASGWRDWL